MLVELLGAELEGVDLGAAEVTVSLTMNVESGKMFSSARRATPTLRRTSLTLCVQGPEERACAKTGASALKAGVIEAGAIVGL